MDGGRVARAIAWWRTGDRTAATRFAANLGRVFAYLFIGGGLHCSCRPADVFGGVWLALIGMVINGSARGAAMQTQITGRVSEILVADVMDREPVAIPGGGASSRLSTSTSCATAGPGSPWSTPLTASSASPSATAPTRSPRSPAPALWSRTCWKKEFTGSFQVRDDTPLDSLLGNQNLRRFGALMAVDADGRLKRRDHRRAGRQSATRHRRLAQGERAVLFVAYRSMADKRRRREASALPTWQHGSTGWSRRGSC